MISCVNRACSTCGDAIAGDGPFDRSVQCAECEVVDLREEVEALSSALAMSEADALASESLREENERLTKRQQWTSDWWSERWETLADYVREYHPEAWPKVAAIMANGSAYPEAPPTYAQRMSVVAHERDSLRDENERLRSMLRSAHHNDGRQQ